jgi:hypothetical protein
MGRLAERVEKNKRKVLIVFPTLASNFFSPNAWNPPLFIRGGRWILSFLGTNLGP